MVVDEAVRALPAHGRLQLQLHDVEGIHGSRGASILQVHGVGVPAQQLRLRGSAMTPAPSFSSLLLHERW
jgi:hypothetical protein